MPMITLTLPHGTLDETGLAEIQATLSRTLLKWEGAPDTEFFRAQTWCRIDEVPAGRFAAHGDQQPRFRVDATVPQGALSDRRKERLIVEVTDQVLHAAGLTDADALAVWVLIHEQPEGTWGAGGHVVRFADLKAVAQPQRSATTS